MTSRRGFLTSGLAAAAATSFVAEPAFADAERPADAIFFGGPIHTMDARRPRAEAMAIRGQTIVAVGSRERVFSKAGPATRRIDLKGRALTPAFVDPHMHTAYVNFDDWLDTTSMRLPSLADVAAALRAQAASTPSGNWVRAHGFDRGTLKDGRAFTLAELDAMAPANPLFMIELNGHVAYVNTAALALAGINRDTPDPRGGRFDRDADGALTGRLDEAGAFLPFMIKMPKVSPDEMQSRIRRLFERSAAVGCTLLHDCGVGFLGGASDLHMLQAAMAGDQPVRLRGMLDARQMPAWEKLGLKPGFGDDRFRIDGMKIIGDGSNPGRTGYMREPYLGGSSRGIANYTVAGLTEEIGRAHAQGWQVGVHSNGDAAIETATEAFAAVLAAAPRADHRHRLEHCSLLHADQIARMRQLGLSPSFLIGHVRWWGRLFRDEFLGPQRAADYDPCASALRGGLRISLHSDYGVTPLDPLRCVEDAVARKMADGGEVFYPAERIPVLAALKAVTLDAAWQCRADHLVGSLEPGKRADLAILEDDPVQVAPTAISRIKVSETWLDGRLRHSA